jgi:hypothetical protein
MLSMGRGSPLRSQKILGELPPAVCNDIKKNLPRDLTKVGQKELLDQFLRAATCAWRPILTTSASEPRGKPSAVRLRKGKLSSVNCCRSLTTSNARSPATFLLQPNNFDRACPDDPSNN